MITGQRLYIPSAVMAELAQKLGGSVETFFHEHGMKPLYTADGALHNVIVLDYTTDPFGVLKVLCGFAEVGSYFDYRDPDGVMIRVVMRGSRVEEYSRDAHKFRLLFLSDGFTLKSQCVADAVRAFTGWCARNDFGIRSHDIGPYWVSQVKAFADLAAELGIKYSENVVGNVIVDEIDNTVEIVDILIKLWEPYLLRCVLPIVAIDRAVNDIWVWSLVDAVRRRTTGRIHIDE